MKRADYIKEQAGILKRLCDQREKKSRSDSTGLSPKQAQKRGADLNFLGMNIEQTKERIHSGLGYWLLRAQGKSTFRHRFIGMMVLGRSLRE